MFIDGLELFFEFLGSPAISPRSFPPSPQRTPSRKQSLVCVNPFALCPTALDEIQKNPQEACETVSRLLDQVYKFFTVLCSLMRSRKL